MAAATAAAAGRATARSVARWTACGAWVAPVPQPAAGAASGSAAVAVGLGPAAADALGDVVGIEAAAKVGQRVPAGGALARVRWEALTRTEADELYHAAWGHAAGVATLRAPFAATVIEFNPEALADASAVVGDAPCPRDANSGWLVRLRPEPHALDAVMSVLDPREPLDPEPLDR